jgi:hypothetical protein
MLHRSARSVADCDRQLQQSSGSISPLQSPIAEREIVETVVYCFVGIYLFEYCITVVLVGTVIGEVSVILVTFVVAEKYLAVAFGY